ncbi:hypothetical protein CSIM01_13169 [Colletotrichum simmondsii]|uniref:Uncharacterized protein n=1 Tax=Colletotrichum simmondsii TaxID=703756 RepID=A0A135RV23_9PEZI|nr:hypothetical protein CSIM01_13169 [Colletotrichum simmondsii]
MLFKRPILLAVFAAFAPLCGSFSVTQTNDANILANAIFNGPGITVLQATFSGAAVSSGTFTAGLGGIGNGAILTTGSAVGALPGGDHYVNNGAAGSAAYCGPSTFNAAILSVDIAIDPGYSGVQVEFILASEEEGGSADPIGIYLGGQQYSNGITAVSNLLAQPIVITPPNSVTSYPGSSPPLLVGIPASGAQTMVFAICDKGDSEWDSALMLNAAGCVDCDPVVKIDYVTITSIVAAGQEPKSNKFDSITEFNPNNVGSLEYNEFTFNNRAPLKHRKFYLRD